MAPVISPGPGDSKKRLFLGNRWLRTMCAVLLVLAVLWLLGWGNSPLQVVVELQSRAGADGQVFYARTGQAYAPDRSVNFAINPDGQWHTYRIELPDDQVLNRVRIDPGSDSGIVEIRRVGIEATGHSVELVGHQLSSAVGIVNLMHLEASDGTDLRFVARSPDPFLDFKLPVGAGVPSYGVQFISWGGAAIAAALLWLLLGEVIWPRFARRRAAYLRIPRVFHRVAACTSDPNVLIVTPRALFFVVLALCAGVLYIALDLNQSSIGVWQEMFPAQSIKQLVDIGTPKHIRSDEWNTQTPWILNQVARGDRDHNLSIGGEEAPLLAAVPSSHSWEIAQGQFYGFHLFGSARGFSWFWAYKTLGLALAFFWLFLLLTRGNTIASGLGAAWVYGSSFTQWWLSSNLPELMIAFAFAAIGCIYLFFARRRIMVAAGAAMLVYAVLNLLLHLYPPFIVPLAYLGAAILIGLMLEPGGVARIRQGLGWRAGCLIAAALVMGLIGGNYLMDAMPSINAMANTSYPGLRVSVGGNFPLTRLFYGFFEVFRIGEQRLPLPPTNASEASSFIILVPSLLLVMPFAAFMRRKNALLVALTLYCLAVGLWISVPLPGVVERALQLIGWSWSPPRRSVLGFGLGSVIAATVLFSRIRAGTVDLRPAAIRWMVPVVVWSSLLLFGRALHGMDPVFFSPQVVLLASTVVATMAAGIVLGRTGLFAAGLAIAVTPALIVNPLVSGVSAIEDKPILVAAKRQGDAAADRWAVVGSFIFAQGLKAQGLEVITGSQMIPNREMAHVFDPQGKYKGIWNRYAHVTLSSDPGQVAPIYTLLHQDQYQIGLDICGPALRRLGVTRVAYTTPVPDADLKCLTPLEAPAGSGVRLFRFSAPKAGSSP